MDDIDKQTAAKEIFSKIIDNLENLLKMEIINRIDDSKYMGEALEITLQEAKSIPKNNLSKLVTVWKN